LKPYARMLLEAAPAGLKLQVVEEREALVCFI
jgi:hypothetical protein